EKEMSLIFYLAAHTHSTRSLFLTFFIPSTCLYSELICSPPSTLSIVFSVLYLILLHNILILIYLSIFYKLSTYSSALFLLSIHFLLLSLLIFSNLLKLLLSISSILSLSQRC